LKDILRGEGLEKEGRRNGKSTFRVLCYFLTAGTTVTYGMV